MERLAYLCLSTAWGGLEMNQLRSAQEMQARGHEVLLIANIDSPIHLAAKLADIPIYIVQQKPKHYQWCFALKLVVLLTKKSYHHLLFRNNREQSIAASISFFSSGKIKTHYFMEMALGGKRNQFFRTLRYHFFSTWVCPLPYLKTQVLANTKLNAAKIKEIPSGLNFKTVTTLNKKQAREQLGWPHNAKLIVVVGRIDPKKRQRFIWESFTKRTHFNEFLVFVGAHTLDESEHYALNLKKDIEGHQKNENIIWAGFQENMALVYRAADLIVMAAENETVGMATLEALQHNCPVVGANNGGSKSIINQFGGGLCFEATNMNSLNYGIDQVFEKNFPSLKKQDFQQHFDFDRVCHLVETEVLKC